VTGSSANGRPLDRNREIAQMVLGGATLAELSERFGARTQGSAKRLVERALESHLPHLDSNLDRRVDLARLDQGLRVWWEDALGDDPFATLVVLAAVETRSRVLATERDASASIDHRPPTTSPMLMPEELIQRAGHYFGIDEPPAEPPGPGEDLGSMSP
jgi:hypothetical protein